MRFLSFFPRQQLAYRRAIRAKQPSHPSIYNQEAVDCVDEALIYVKSAVEKLKNQPGQAGVVFDLKTCIAHLHDALGELAPKSTTQPKT